LLVVTITVALAAAAVVAAIVVVAVGGGGQLSAEHPDHPPLALPGQRAVGGTDAALLRLPLGLWGYHKQITDEALHRFAHELTERDTRIAVLEQALAEARDGRDGGTPGPRSALPAARTDVPVTRTEPRPALPAPGDEALVTRTEGVDAGDAAHAPPTDPWKTILDGRDEAPSRAENDAAGDDQGRAPERKGDRE
jgi:hypothetical protein